MNKTLDSNCRRAGLFVPAFTIRTDQDLGVGDTRGVREMIDWCRDAGFGVLQLLPINETSGDNSPYNAISSRALDITGLHISPKTIPGLSQKAIDEAVTEEERKTLNKGPVRYRRVKSLKLALCETAFKAWDKGSKVGADSREMFETFCREEEKWLEPYGYFRALMEKYESSPVWERWRPEHGSPKKACKWEESLSSKERKTFETRRAFFCFVQWLLHKQWREVAAYGETQGVYLMGDIPFGVSRHSCDVWSHPDIFNLEWSGGAPPEPLFAQDLFTKKWGQNWGIPPYRWDRMKENGFEWWRQRIRGVTDIFRLFRLDHVLGFYRLYSFPWQPDRNAEFENLSEEEARNLAGDLPRFFPSEDQTPEGMKINQEHGEALLRMVLDAAGDAVVIGEDLGMVPDYMRPSLESMGISGFRIPMFTRHEGSREYVKSEEYPSLTLCTLSTHDHETMAGTWDLWWKTFDEGESSGDPGQKEKGTQASWELYRTLRFAGMDDRELIRPYAPAVHRKMVEQLMASRSWLAILMITDCFALKQRFNVPGPVSESNWSERLPFTVKTLRRSEKWKEATASITETLRECGRRPE